MRNCGFALTSTTVAVHCLTTAAPRTHSIQILLLMEEFSTHLRHPQLLVANGLRSRGALGTL